MGKFGWIVAGFLLFLAVCAAVYWYLFIYNKSDETLVPMPGSVAQMILPNPPMRRILWDSSTQKLTTAGITSFTEMTQGYRFRIKSDMSALANSASLSAPICVTLGSSTDESLCLSGQTFTFVPYDAQNLYLKWAFSFPTQGAINIGALVNQGGSSPTNKRNVLVPTSDGSFSLQQQDATAMTYNISFTSHPIQLQSPDASTSMQVDPSSPTVKWFKSDDSQMFQGMNYDITKGQLTCKGLVLQGVASSKTVTATDASSKPYAWLEKTIDAQHVQYQMVSVVSNTLVQSGLYLACDDSNAGSIFKLSSTTPWTFLKKEMSPTI